MPCAWRAPPSRPACRWSRCTAARASRATRAHAEYDTIAAVKAALRIPVVANGDIDSPHKARAGAGRHGRRRADDRPRGPGPALDLSRDQPLPGHRRAAGAAAGRRGPARAAGAPGRPLHACTANTPACARRASTSAGMCANCRVARPSAPGCSRLKTARGSSTPWPTYFDVLGSTLDRLPARPDAAEAGETMDDLLEIAE